MAGALLDLYLVLAGVYVRRRQNAGDIHCPDYLPHPGFVLAIDLCVTAGLLAWGGLTAFFGIYGEHSLYYRDQQR